MEDKLIPWLNAQLDTRGWSHRELARRAGLSQTVVSGVLSGQKTPGPKFCAAIARPLETPPETIQRMAGLLPSLPAPIEEENEIVAILRTIAPEGRTLILQMLRGLTGVSPSLSLSEAPANYQTAARPVITIPTLVCELEAFLKDFPELEELVHEAQARLSEPALRALMINVRVFAEAADKMSFAQYHRQLSDFFAEESAA